MTTVLDFLAKGGPVMVPILGCSVLTIATALERTLFWTKLLRREDQVVSEVLDASRRDLSQAVQSLDLALDALRSSPDAPLPDFGEWTGSHLRPLPLTVTVLRLRGGALERGFGETPAAAGLRDGLKTYELAADVLERVRERVVETEQVNVRLNGGG